MTSSSLSSAQLVATLCPVCHHGVAVKFLDAGRHPLATLGWPDSEAAALSMPPLPQDFVQCPKCTHVWNRSFTYDDVPYTNNANRMFNTGGIWKGHLAQTRDLILERLGASPTVIDIGCGEGHFVRGLAEGREGAGRFIGFDPNTTPESGKGVEFHARYFNALDDFDAFNPDAITIRHVLEHLTDPAALLEELAWAASRAGKTCYLFAETPCIDRVPQTRRLADFFYEHMSHFTTRSFRTLMERAGEVVTLEQGYNGEVVYALVKLGVGDAALDQARQSAAFHDAVEISRKTISDTLNELHTQGRTVAVWGGTGKAAAFMHQFGVDRARFPVVVDSDPAKVGTFVPGQGQEIRSPELLKTEPVDVIIIPTQWRAKDIAQEIAREGIQANQLLIEHDGQLVDYHTGEHPYS
jgi:ubiquinone/menaquinone biosynthesis C-methylase UbiE